MRFRPRSGREGLPVPTRVGRTQRPHVVAAARDAIQWEGVVHNSVGNTAVAGGKLDDLATENFRCGVGKDVASVRIANRGFVLEGVVWEIGPENTRHCVEIRSLEEIQGHRS